MLVKAIGVLLVVSALSLVAELNTPKQKLPATMSFGDWKLIFKPKYADNVNSEEHTLREETFNKNIKKIIKHNKSGKTWTMGVNQFADLTADEFKALVSNPFKRTRKPNMVKLEPTDASSVDWRAQGAVTAVKNQGQCGSCWAFSTTGSTEGDVKIEDGTLTSLSEQQLVDCARAEGNNGCKGGLMDYGFEYIIKNHGEDSEDDYPYNAEDGSCNTAKASRVVATITGYNDVQSNSNVQMHAAVAQQPVSIAIEADKGVFQMYTGGVMSSDQCGTKLDHGVLCVGYGTDPVGGDYWIVKNSWGGQWGEQGYIRLGRGTSGDMMNTCGILMNPSYPKGGKHHSPGPGPGPGPGPSPSPTKYEKPPCSEGESALRVTGIDGSFCSPECQGWLKSCVAAPSAINGEASCILHTSDGTNYCGVECEPTDPSACDPSAGMKCRSIQSAGICTWDDDAAITEGKKANKVSYKSPGKHPKKKASKIKRKKIYVM